MKPAEGKADTQSIVAEYNVPFPPEKVWRALTDAEMLGNWLMPNDLRPEVGHRFTFRTQPMPGFDGVVHCEVLAVEPPRRISYSWCGGHAPGRPGAYTLNTVVTWTLTPTAEGTRLHLEQSGFRPENAFAFETMGKGWRTHVLARMEELLRAAA